MTEEIIIASQDNSKDKIESGIYAFPWMPNDGKKDGEGVKRRVKPNLILVDEKQVTPRLLKYWGGKICAFTRAHLGVFDPTEGISGTFKDVNLLEDILGSSVGGVEIGQLVNQDAVQFGISSFRERELFLAIFHSDSAKQRVRGGILYHSSSGFLDDLQPVPSVSPTGMIVEGKGELWVASGRKLEALVKERDEWKVRRSLRMGSNVLAVAHNDGFTVASNIKEGYVVDHAGNTRTFLKAPGFEYFLDNENRDYLPSEATSIAIVKYKKAYHLLFGVDDGRILVYKLSEKLGIPQISYEKTLSLFSTERTVSDAHKDNHIWNLQQTESKYIGLTLRNMYLRIGMEQLLGLDPERRITAQEERTGPSAYLKNLRATYNLDAAFSVPHRITSWEMVKR